MSLIVIKRSRVETPHVWENWIICSCFELWHKTGIVVGCRSKTKTDYSLIRRILVSIEHSTEHIQRNTWNRLAYLGHSTEWSLFRAQVIATIVTTVVTNLVVCSISISEDIKHSHSWRHWWIITFSCSSWDIGRH